MTENDKHKESTLFEDVKILEERKDLSWDRFLELAKQGKKPEKVPRNTVYLDSDLHTGLKELNIPGATFNTSISTLINAIVRSFVEVNSQRLKPFRKQVQSVFDNI